MPIKDPLAREFYLTMAASEHWSKRTLESKIDGMLYERTAIATKPEELIKQELTECLQEPLFPRVYRIEGDVQREEFRR